MIAIHTSTTTVDFPLARGDLLFRLQRGVGLIPADGLALLDCGELIGRHGRLVHKRWIEGGEIGQALILEAPELGPVADTAAMYDNVRSAMELARTLRGTL